MAIQNTHQKARTIDSFFSDGPPNCCNLLLLYLIEALVESVLKGIAMTKEYSKLVEEKCKNNSNKKYAPKSSGFHAIFYGWTVCGVRRCCLGSLSGHGVVVQGGYRPVG